MDKTYMKRDRTARLLRVQMLLSEYPQGIRIEEIADKCDVSKRTAYRDLIALESELGVPIWEEGNKRGVAEGYFLPPISFTRVEAANLFMAIRLLRRYAHLDKSTLISTFMKLYASVPPILKNQIQYVIKDLEDQQQDKRIISNYNRIIEAWLSQHAIKIRYQTLSDEGPVERTIEPYYIEPSTRRSTSYLIAYCRYSQSIIVINVDHIVGEVVTLPEVYQIPVNFNAIDYLKLSWDVRQGSKPQIIKLHVSQRLGSTLKYSILHPSRKFELLSDGSAILTLKFSYSEDFCSWILGWGDDIKVLEPEELKRWVIDINRSVRCIYRTNKLPAHSIFSNPTRWMDNLNADTELTDNQWALINKILPSKPWTGRPRVNDRRTINGILWVLRNGFSWGDIPSKYGAPSTCNSRFLSWEKSGLWGKICQILVGSLDEAQRLAVGEAISGSRVSHKYT
jgi:predicted DNA-binding transcriptional regulator YafY/transposase